MPSLGISILSSALQMHHIEHEVDDLYVKLYHALKNKSINIDVFLDTKKVEDFINGVPCDEIKNQVEKILQLTDYLGYDYICFSRHCCSRCRINPEALIACIIKTIKERTNSIIIANFALIKYAETRLIDFHTEDIDIFIKILKARQSPANNQIKLPRTNRENKYVFLKPNFNNVPLNLYKFSMKTLISEFIQSAVPACNLTAFNRIFKGDVTLLPFTFIDGCQGRCIFCEHSGRADFVIKDYDKIVRDLKSLCIEHKTKDFIFLNSNINPTKKNGLDLADSIIKSGLKINFTDCANFNNLDEELLIKLKRAGAVRLVLGLESASFKIQKYLGKIIDLKHASKMLKICYQLGIWAEIDLLAGLPHENADDIIATLIFIRNNYRYIRNINLNRFIVKHSSLMYLYPEKYGIMNVRKMSDPHDHYKFEYDEAGGLKWNEKRKQAEYRYSRFLECMHSNKVDYVRPVQFIFLLNRYFKSVDTMNDFLDNYFFAGKPYKIDKFIQELEKDKIS